MYQCLNTNKYSKILFRACLQKVTSQLGLTPLGSYINFSNVLYILKIHLNGVRSRNASILYFLSSVLRPCRLFA